jgi:membrane fusion protein (multidrug efflux system)
MRRAVGAVLLICALAAPASAQQQPAEIPVGVVKAERRSIEETRSFVGRIEAINRLQIRARVTGFLEEVLFTEGGSVKAGDHLYRIEPGLFEAAVKQAEGTLDRAKANKILTAVQLQRAQELLSRGTGTVVARDQAQAADQQADGDILVAQAALDTAKINLSYTDITAAVAGRISKTNITKGNVVGPDSGVLTTVVSQDPMYVSFPVSQRDFQETEDAARRAAAKAKVRIRFANGKVYEHEGEIDFIDVTVDRTTDTVLVRATIANPNSDLIDGQFVQVEAVSGTPEERVLIPQAALIADQGGVYVFIVEDGKAVVRRIKVGSARGADVIVEDGLKGGELVIVEGLQRVKPGMAVRANPLPRTLGGT